VFYKLILLDYSMPNIDGPETARRICQLYKTDSETSNFAPPKPYIVCLTAFTEKIFEENALDAGMSEFVSKPISSGKLKQILRKCHLIGLSELTE
jgi:CheY-like chemotaxis protein